MNMWLIIGAAWALGMVLGWAFVHGAAKLRAEEDAAMAATAPSEYDTAEIYALAVEDEPVRLAA
ncbi:MAG TPA: hypothetical protein VF867_19625 [Arthrobacter sp.]